MSLPAKWREEIRSVGLTTVYFAGWFLLLLFLKWLVLTEYRIEFRSWSMALIGALIVAKVVLVLENVPLGALTRDRRDRRVAGVQRVARRPATPRQTRAAAAFPGASSGAAERRALKRMEQKSV